jgi:hypothetical protein
MFRKFFLLVLVGWLGAVGADVSAQISTAVNSLLLKDTWPAKWISAPGISGKEFGVYLFRKSFMLEQVPAKLVIHVSADNRYKLYVNQKYAGNGPARGDLFNWHFESIDIAPFLKEGKNVISAIVWNFADDRPMAQFSAETGLIVQTDAAAANFIDTDSSWLVQKDTAYAPLPVNINQYYVAGPGEQFNCRFHPWQWMEAELDAAGWSHARELEQGKPINSLGAWGQPPAHVLKQRTIPAMEEKRQRFSKIRRSDLAAIPDQFVKGERSFTIPANHSVKILFDQEQLTNAYPVLIFSGGANSQIKITYAESLVDEKSAKGNRNDIEQKHIVGNHDLVIADGGTKRVFQTLWWRSFRYVEMEITTKETALVLDDLYSIFTGYPFQEKASFSCSDPVLSAIWNAGWHTQRLCAGETYFDCPYYEQLQYAGDSRIQSLVSLYVSGDHKLMRNALISLHDSYLSIGLTQSRYPSARQQIIPPFSLVWVTMVHDYWMLHKDNRLVQSMLPQIINVLNWYESKIDATGLTGHMEWWNFVDWVSFKNWKDGVPPGVDSSHSAIISLQYVYTLQKAAALLKAFGLNELSVKYGGLAKRISTAVFKSCYDSQKGLIADTPEKINFSQHANVFAILTGTVAGELQQQVANTMLHDKSIAPASFYFHFYLAEALEKAGLADQYTSMLAPWKQMLNEGFTTFAESADHPRSDCHAWSASPVYYFLSLICGVKTAGPGFDTVSISPHLGNLQWIKSSVPHRLGMIEMSLKKATATGIEGEVVLPSPLTGNFLWKGKAQQLKTGVNHIHFK